MEKASKDKKASSGTSDFLCEEGYGKAICCCTGNSRCWFSGILSRLCLAWNSFIVRTPGNDSHSWRTNSHGMIQERVGGGTEAFRRIQQEHYFPMSRRVSTELHWYFSHMLEPELMTVGLEAAVPGRMKQHWQWKFGLKQINRDLYNPSKSNPFPALGCTSVWEQPLEVWEVKALLLPSHQGGRGWQQGQAQKNF